jgi:hypothetical protein
VPGSLLLAGDGVEAFVEGGHSVSDLMPDMRAFGACPLLVLTVPRPGR